MSSAEFNTYLYGSAQREEALGRPAYRAGASEVTSMRLEDLIADDEPAWPSDGRSVPQKLAIASCAVAIGTLVPVALYQSGAIDHLPDPPLPAFRSEWVTNSLDARRFGIPDAYLGLASYAATLGLLISQRRTPAMNIARHAKLGLDAVVAGVNTARQVRNRRYCSWCMGTAAATGAMLWFGYLAGKKRREEAA